MIQVQYFARYREALGLDSEAIEWDSALRSLDDVRARLLARGPEWSVLGERNLMCARNQELCSLQEPLVDGDEVSFFPTVTGG